ncbi:obscurin, partial [Caerostris extrusa]
YHNKFADAGERRDCPRSLGPHLKPEGAPKVKVSPRRKYQQEFTERTPDYQLEEFEIPILDYSRETEPVPLVESDPLELGSDRSLEMARQRHLRLI